MQSSQIERTLRGMIADEQKRVREEERRKAGGRRLWLFRERAPKPVKVKMTRKQGGRRGDLIVAALGIALGFGSAAFPWYIFLNPDKFGIRAMKFSGAGDRQEGPIYLGSKERIGAPMSVDEIPPMQLDLFATGSSSRSVEGEATPTLEDQPFPGDVVSYRLVHVVNGRAMIADDSGFWVVQAGSLLPDNSTVSKIEKRGGKWVLVTSNEQVLELSAQ